MIYIKVVSLFRNALRELKFYFTNIEGRIILYINWEFKRNFVAIRFEDFEEIFELRGKFRV